MRFLGILIYTLIVWGCLCLPAQNKQLLYDFTDNPQALLINPGMEASYQWYASIPLLSGFSFQAGTSGATINDVFANDGGDINERIRERVVFGQTNRDELSGTYQIQILNGGFRGKKRPENFYSFGLYNEGDAISYWFRDLAILALDGNGNSVGRRFDLSDLKLRGEIVNVYHFGVNKRVNRRLTAGIRGKLYSSVVNFNSSRNSGFFQNTSGENNRIATTLDADLQLRTSGIRELVDALDDDNLQGTSGIPQILARRLLLGGNLGLGADIGFTYHLSEQTVITGSLSDIGFIYHSKDTENYTLNGRATSEGAQIILPSDIDTNTDFFENLVDDIEGLIPFESNNNAYISFRPTRFNGSIRHNFGKELNPRGNRICNCNPRKINYNEYKRYSNGLGVQVYAVNRPRGPQTALTAFYQKQFGNVLGIKATYTADKFTRSNVGLGINLQAGPIHIYGAVDNLLGYGNIPDTNYISFQFGLNIISW